MTSLHVVYRTMAQCQAAIAAAVTEFGRLDILFSCASEGESMSLDSPKESFCIPSILRIVASSHTRLLTWSLLKALIGTVEELAASPRTQSLVREQVETNFFGPINCIKACLPTMRKQGNGHIIALTGISKPLPFPGLHLQCLNVSKAGHLGTPGLGAHCAADWALEGFCDSLAYEIAPFNVKVTIVQPNLEVQFLTNKITAAPAMAAYAPENNPAPLSRGIFGGLLGRIHRDGSTEGEQSEGEQRSDIKENFAGPEITSLYPSLSGETKAELLAETVHAVVAIAGHENPPARHIVGVEGVASVKEKLKTVSEEMEDFVEVSCAVDIDEGEGIAGGAGNQTRSFSE